MVQSLEQRRRVKVITKKKRRIRGVRGASVLEGEEREEAGVEVN